MEKSERNYGIDLLRIVSMIMVVTLHVLGKGGIVKAYTFISARYVFVHFVEIACFCAVCCYALISGFVGYGRRFKLTGIIKLWFLVAFYLFTINIVFMVIKPGTVGVFELLKSFLPVSSGTYWFFTAYFATIIISPFYNFIIEKLSLRKSLLLILSLIFVFLIFPKFFGGELLNHGDLFMVADGYSPLYLSIVYMMGAFIKKYRLNEKVNSRLSVLVFFLSIVFTLLFKITMGFLSKITVVGSYFTNIFVSYTSPTIILCGICLFFVFSNLKTSGIINKFISFFAPAAFSVYIIHLHPVFEKLIINRFVLYTGYSFLVFILAIICTVFAIWFICSIIDKLRELLFKLIRINVLSDKLNTIISTFVNRTIDAFAGMIE